jgi:hypothetical protein
MAAQVQGNGEHTYEVVEGWGQLPDGVAYGYTHGVAEDSQGRMYIHNQSPSGDSMIVFDADGTYIKSWGADYAGGAHGLTLNKEGSEEFLYLADQALKKVFKTTLDGEVVLELPFPEASGAYATPDEYVPTNTAIASNGDIYVGDGYGQSWIHRYSASGELLQSWGGKGEEAGKMQCPHGLAIDSRDGTEKLVVADRANIRLQYFSLDGEHLGFVNDELRFPCHFDLRGDDLLIPDLFGRVTIFDKDNKLITHIGDTPGVNDRDGYPNLSQDTWETGKFISPHSACWDHEGNLYVVEWIEIGRVTKMRRVN